MPSEYQQDYKKTCAYALKIYNDPNMSDTLWDIYRTLESRYVHEGRTIDPSFYNDLSDDLVAKFTAIGIYIYSDAWGLDELEKTLEQIEAYNLRLPALDDIRNLIHRRTVHEKIDKEGNTIYNFPNQIETNELFDHPRSCEIVIGENVYSAIGNRDYTQAVIALMALNDDPNMSKEQGETKEMFKNLGRALRNFARRSSSEEQPNEKTSSPPARKKSLSPPQATSKSISSKSTDYTSSSSPKMDQDSAYMMAASKVPMLKPSEYEHWRMSMKQYIQMVDYSLWDVIENGNAPLITKVVKGDATTIAPVTAEEKAQRRFGGNAATKKTQRNLLKQQYENFTQSNSEMLDQTFDKLQKLISKLEILGENISQEDVNKKFLTSLSPEWNTHTIVWRNKPKIDTLSLDDLYNNLKIYEQEVKGTSSSNTNTQNVAFMSSNNNININGAVNNAYGVTTASTQATAVNSTKTNNLSDAVICSFFASQPNSLQHENEDLKQIHFVDLEDMYLRWQMAMQTMKAMRFLKNTRRKFSMNGNDTIGFDKSKVE
nr:hypothetical protein [Tanacetum cinerariifolium]